MIVKIVFLVLLATFHCQTKFYKFDMNVEEIQEPFVKELEHVVEQIISKSLERKLNLVRNYTKPDDHSGMMFGIDFRLLEQLKGRNFDSLVRNKTLVNETGIDIGSDSFFGYKVHLANIVFDTLRYPSEVNINPHEVSGVNTVGVTLKNLQLSLLADYSVKVVGISDSGKATPVNVTLSTIDVEFSFDNTGLINFSKFKFELGELDVKLNSWIYKFVFWAFKSFITGAVTKQQEKIKTSLISFVNDFVTKPLLIDVGFGIGFNLTNTDIPQLKFYNDTALHLRSAQNQTNTATLLFGVHGSMYANLDPSLRPNIPEAVNMAFNKENQLNDFSILLSDYSLNTIFFMLQQSSFLRYSVKNDTSNPLPMTIDTKGLSQLIPELGTAFPENFPVIMNLQIDPFDNRQPIISSSLYGSNLNLNATLEFNVVNSTDPFDDPVKAVTVTLNADILAQLVTSEDGKLSVKVAETNVSKVDINSIIGPVPEERTRKSIDSMLFIASKQMAISNLDINKYTTEYLGLSSKHFDIDYNEGYTQISIDLRKP